jgi:hypothetical protein
LAVWEIVEQQLACSILKVEPLLLGIFNETNPTIKVGAISLRDSAWFGA